MHRFRFRPTGVWALASLFLITACGGGDSPSTPDPEPEPNPNEVGTTGGTVTAQGGAVTLAIPAGAVSGNVVISVTPTTDPANDPNTLPGTVYNFEPSGTQFAQPVTLTLRFDPSALPAGFPPEAIRIATYTNGAWQPTGGTVTVNPTAGTVTGQINGFSAKAAVVDPCALRTLSLEMSGTISDRDCLFEDEFRTTYEEVYTVDPAALAAAAGISTSETPRINVRFETEFDHLIGFQKAGEGDDGLVYRFRQTNVDSGSGTAVSEFSMYAGDDAYRLFIGGDSQSDTGAYTLEISVDEGGTFDPTADPGAVAGSATFTSSFNASTTYEGQVNVGPATGTPLRYQYRLARLEAGKSYRYAVEDISGTNLDAFLSATPVSSGIDRVLQTPSSEDDRDREIQFTASVNGFYYLEVSTVTASPSATYRFVFEEIAAIDACAATPLGGLQLGSITATDCRFTAGTADRYQDRFAVTLPSGPNLTTFTTNASFEGIFGIKQPASTGEVVYGSRNFVPNTDRPMYVLADGGDFEVFLGGTGIDDLGTYSLSRWTSSIGDYFCGSGFIATEITFSGVLRADNACAGTITFGPYVGNPLRYQFAYAKLEAGRTYRFTTTGFDPNTPFAFFSSGLGVEGSGELLLTENGETTLVRDVTPTVDGYWYVEWSLGGSNPPVTGWTFTFEAVN